MSNTKVSETPQKLEILNENFHFYMNLFLNDNWENIPNKFVENISNYIDSLLEDKITLLESLSSDIIPEIEISENATTEESIRYIKNFRFQRNISEKIKCLSISCDNKFYDDSSKKVISFIRKTFSKNQLDKIKPLPKQKSEFSGYKPKGYIFNFDILSENSMFISRNESQYEEFSCMLSTLILGYKLSSYIDMQSKNIIKLSKDTTITEEKFNYFLIKTIVNKKNKCLEMFS